MVEIVRKALLPAPRDVTPELHEAAALALSIKLREPRPAGFPMLFTADMALIEPAVAYLHEHSVRCAHTLDTLNTYTEILYDWFDSLEQSDIDWRRADAADLVAYRNRMLSEPSPHTRRPYSVRTINHRVRGVLRFYQWMARTGWIRHSELAGIDKDFAIARRWRPRRCNNNADSDRSLFFIRQFESLPRPLMSEQLRELLARLPPPYDLMARWQLYTGLRVGELLKLTVTQVSCPERGDHSCHAPALIDVTRKGRKSGYVIASPSLLEETAGYVSVHRCAWIKRAERARRATDRGHLFINSRGKPVQKNSYQQVIADTGKTCGFRATSHLLRASFACMMLARLERLAHEGAMINPLLIVKVLMGHEHIDTTDRYLRAIAVDTVALSNVLDSLLEGQ